MDLKAGILTIGQELLNGFTVDTNSAWIGKRLLEKGVKVTDKVSVGDSREEIRKALRYISEECDLVIVTGGLGPTHDDTTQEAITEFFKSKVVFDEEYWDTLVQKYSTMNRKISDVNRSQAYRPNNCDMIPNETGTARGLHFKKKKKNYFFMPGVPGEMKGMMLNTVLPFVETINDSDVYIKTLRTTGVPEANLVEILGEERIHRTGIDLAFLPQIPGVDLRVSGKDLELVETWIKEVRGLLGKKIYTDDGASLEEVIAGMLTKKGLTLSVAESCTGGLLGHRLTSISGSSKFFTGGIIAYDNAVKMSQLGISEFDLTTYGAVSEEVAVHMAEGVRDYLKTDYSIGITGIAGPLGGTDEKPVGLVYIGLATPVETLVKKYQFKASRDINKLLASENALNLLRMYLLEHE